MTKETLERAKTLDENIYYIKKLLHILINDKGLTLYSSITGDEFRFNTLDLLTRNIIMEDMKDTLNERIEEMKRELEEL